MDEQALTPFEEAELKLQAFGENMARSQAVDKLIHDLIHEERTCSVPISGSIGASFQSEEYQAAISTLQIVATMDAIMGISA
jgi:hypothetical protein